MGMSVVIDLLALLRTTQDTLIDAPGSESIQIQQYLNRQAYIST